MTSSVLAAPDLPRAPTERTQSTLFDGMSSVFLSYLLFSFLHFIYIFFTQGGLEISGKVRSKTQDIPSKSVDCVLSVGALGRSGAASTELVTEVYR